MSLYKQPAFLQASSHTAFDETHTPGTIAANSGIYRCTGCGDEIAANKGNPLPSQNSHQHSPSTVAIRWQLTVCAVQR